MNKDTKKLLKLARECGLTVKQGSKHVKVFGRDGHLVAILPLGSKSSSQPWNQRNALAALRRAAGC